MPETIPAAYSLVRQRFDACRRSFDDLEAAHRRGSFQGPDHQTFIAALEQARDAMSDLRAHAQARRAAVNEGISSTRATLHRLEGEMADRKSKPT